jgi:peptide/nickel transport system ATP-binding protein
VRILTLLDIDNLTVQYRTGAGVVTALNSINLELGKNELVALVGESGCGKSTLGLSVIGLLPQNTSRVTSGSINYKGTDLAKLNKNEIRRYRGTEIAMIFQEPLTSLNPVYRIGDQIAEAITVRNSRKGSEKNSSSASSEVMQNVYNSKSSQVPSKVPRLKRSIPRELRNEIIDWLKLVRISDPDQVLDRYPFELSGGMRQRVIIAMALSQRPALLIADEPTTALDVTTQAQVLKLMHELMDEFDTTILLVTHDLAVACQVADRCVVMYAGEVAEEAKVRDLFSNPMHPYTKGLLNCIPSGTKADSLLNPIPGSLPDLMHPPPGCKFATRCPYKFARCELNHPELTITQNNQGVACFLYD